MQPSRPPRLPIAHVSEIRLDILSTPSWGESANVGFPGWLHGSARCNTLSVRRLAICSWSLLAAPKEASRHAALDYASRVEIL